MTRSTSADTDQPWGDSLQERPVEAVSEVVLFMEPGEDRRLLRGALDQEYDVLPTDTAEGLGIHFDLCIVDAAAYQRHRTALQERTDRSGDAFLPLLLTVDGDAQLRSDPDVWTVVDDVVSTPVPKAELRARVDALLRRRRESLRLLDHKQQYRETVAELRVKERAIEAAPFGVSITDFRQDDNPLVYVNEAFQDLTGYHEDEILGRNCRFLQGPATNDDTVGRMRAAIDAEEPVSVELANYEKSGRQFWNGVDIAPVHDHEGAVTHFIGFQRDVTRQKIREQRLTVLNRVLRHNLRNDLSVILGYTEQLQDELEDPGHRTHLGRIRESAAALVELSTAVHDAETALRQLRNPGAPRAVQPMIESVVADLESDYPGRSVSVTIAGADLPAVPNGVQVAIKQAIEIALLDSASDEDPEVVVSRSDSPPDGLAVDVVDNGAGIPDTERVAYTNGNETPLKHADGIGLWLVDWIVRGAGGSVDISDADPGGSVISLQFAGAPVPGTEGNDG